MVTRLPLCSTDFLIDVNLLIFGSSPEIFTFIRQTLENFPFPIFVTPDVEVLDANFTTGWRWFCLNGPNAVGGW